MGGRGGTALAATVLVCAVAAPGASAYKIDTNVVPQPVIRYYVGVSDWSKPFKRIVRVLNRAKVGVRLVRAKIPQQASIQIGRLKGTRCGYPGVNGTTQSIAGGYAAIYLPRGCAPTSASIIGAHELGHALGLLHEDRRCALMNSSGTGSQSTPTQCLGRNYDWLRKPFRLDDLAGLRRLYRNTAPKVKLSLADPAAPATAGNSVFFTHGASDRERNISEVKLDFGDGAVATGYDVSELPAAHAYAAPGTYTAKLTATDFYGRRGTATLTIEVR